jgi:hypothetical protein
MLLQSLSAHGDIYKPIAASLKETSDRYIWNQIMEAKDPWVTNTTWNEILNLLLYF